MPTVTGPHGEGSQARPETGELKAPCACDSRRPRGRRCAALRHLASQIPARDAVPELTGCRRNGGVSRQLDPEPGRRPRGRWRADRGHDRPSGRRGPDRDAVGGQPGRPGRDRQGVAQLLA